LLSRTDLPGRRVGLGLMVVMIFVPLYLQAAAWQAGFGLQGWYTLATRGPVLLEGMAGATWVHAMYAVPWVVLIVAVGLRLVEPELEEQALLECSPAGVFLRVLLPSVASAVLVAALWVAIVTAGEMTVTDLFVVRTYAEVLYTQIAIGQEPGQAAATVMPGIVLTACLTGAALWLCAKLAPRDRPLTQRRQLVYRLGKWKIPAVILVAAVLLLLVGVPLGSLFYKAGVLVTQTEAGHQRAFSPMKLVSTVAESPWRYRREFGWSLLICGLSATTAVVLGALLTWPARQGGKRALPALAAATICLAAPGALIGFAIIRLLNRPDVPLFIELYDNTIFAPVAALVIRSLPPAVLIMWYAFRAVPREMLEAAAVDGAGPFARFFRVVLPCWTPALAVAWLIALAVGLGDLAASILVVPPGVTTLSIRIFGLLHYGVEDQVAGICLAQMCIFAGLCALVASVVWIKWLKNGELAGS
ncbi:MAG: iron ABC transporter permease, partial [Pirellulales bacterium]|nr:iron ABC transporter permease [Pirellulales bacterium]